MCQFSEVFLMMHYILDISGAKCFSNQLIIMHKYQFIGAFKK